MCNAAACHAAKRKLLLKPVIIPQKAAFSSTIANCQHIWTYITDNGMRGVACDFNTPHEISAGLASFCVVCHAVGCVTCV